MAAPRLLATSLALLLLLAVGCGSDGSDEPTAATAPPTVEASDASEADAPEADATDEPTTETTATPASTTEATEASGTAGDDAAVAERIVSLSSTATEILFAIGAGDQVVAVDDQSNHPPEAPITDLSGFQTNVEGVAGYEPDLVILAYEPGEVQVSLEAIGIEVLFQGAAATLDDTYAQILELGERTGHEEEAAALVEQMQADLDELASSVPEREVPLTYYHELDEGLYTVTSDTFFGQLYTMAGLENIADAADPDGEFFGYPQLSPEFLIDADPDFVFLADSKCCGQDAETFAARPGFGDLKAVQLGQVVPLDDDIASRWGPRVVDFFEIIVTATADAA